MDLIEFSCGECGQTFETSNGLQNHVDTEHEDLVVLTDRDQSGPNLINENVEPSANQANDPVSHDLRTRHSLCSSANKSVIASLQADAMPYCNICDKSFANHHGHLIHNGRYHKGLLETNGENDDENRSNEENIEDTAASNPEVAQQIDNNDVVTVVQSTESEQSKENSSFSCEPCGKTYDTYHGLLIHNGRYHKELPKDDGGKGKSIRGAVAKTPAKDKPTAASEERGKRKSVQISDGKQLDEEDEDYVLHACDECDKSYPTYHGLLIHQGRNHKRIKKFACEVCGKRFTERHVCEKHIEAVHLVYNFVTFITDRIGKGSQCDALLMDTEIKFEPN
ncbi:unnamed protein product [Hymenolepis diminuta]|uniref:C2H2-type domain-containing protein n=1 Tax=Hymenolepis diminuta TaxID=6216 RepID=A0A158QDY0_HYMDI|nr:unnamed protein product [Hymenolepis diminuta]